MSKIITVFGATGVQGGSVIKAVLAHPILSKQFKVRAITRDPSKPSAQKLVDQGVEAVKADMHDVKSIEAAVKGSFAVFAVTNYWESRSKETEVKQGKTIADACKAAGVGHIIWSTLYNVTKLTNGVLSHVEHFDSKADVAEYIEETKGDMVATYFMPGFYMSNVKAQIRLQNGTPTLVEPWDPETTRVPLLDTATDTGSFVAGILVQEPSTVNGRYVHAVSQWVSPSELVGTLSKVSGTEVVFKQVPESVFEGFLPPPIAKELTENMVLIRDYSYYGVGSDKEQGKHDELLGGVKPTTWEEFVKTNGPWEWK